MQENQRTTLVGTQTVGANWIQSKRALGDGSGLAVTTSKWLTSQGRDIYKVGLKPELGCFALSCVALKLLATST